MKSEMFLPIVTFPNPCSERFATNAVEVARYLDSDLHAFVLNVDIPKITNAFGDFLLKLPTLVVETEEASRIRGHELLSAITREGAAAGITIGNTFNSVHPDNFGQLAAAQARYYDLAIAGWALDDASGQLTTESLIFESGRPVLLLPETSILNGFDKVMVAWDGSRVAARALADAQPFLTRAKTVEVVSVLDEKPLPHKDIAKKLATALIPSL